jgi:hypothetical protein
MLKLDDDVVFIETVGDEVNTKGLLMIYDGDDDDDDDDDDGGDDNDDDVAVDYVYKDDDVSVEGDVVENLKYDDDEDNIAKGYRVARPEKHSAISYICFK